MAAEVKPPPVDPRFELRLGALLITLAHSCDLLSTYLRTPDLAREVGPTYVFLASHGLGGWACICAIKGVAVLLSIALFAFYVYTRRAFYPAAPGLSFHDFLHHTHSVRAIRRRGGEWVMPSPRLLAIWSAFTLAIGSAAYACFLSVHNMWGTHLLAQVATNVVPAIIFVVTAVVFWHSLYDDYQRLVVAA